MPRHDGVMKGWHVSDSKAGKVEPFKEQGFSKMPWLHRYGLSVCLEYQGRQQDTSELFVSLPSTAEGKQDIGLEGIP